MPGEEILKPLQSGDPLSGGKCWQVIPAFQTKVLLSNANDTMLIVMFVLEILRR